MRLLVIGVVFLTAAASAGGCSSSTSSADSGVGTELGPGASTNDKRCPATWLAAEALCNKPCSPPDFQCKYPDVYGVTASLYCYGDGGSAAGVWECGQ
ncbi:MAG: hypothetical protein ACRENE_30095 [Polyangiaceae bacterium]